MLQAKQPSLAESWRQFHEDEAGIETVEVVLILGIGAIVMLVVWKWWEKIRDWVKGFLQNLIGKSDSGGDI